MRNIAVDGQKYIKRTWIFSGLVLMARIMLVYYGTALLSMKIRKETGQGRWRSPRKPRGLTLFDEGAYFQQNIHNAPLPSSRIGLLRDFKF